MVASCGRLSTRGCRRHTTGVPCRRRRRCRPTHSSGPAHTLQVRTVTGFQPEGVHLAQWSSNSLLVSWQTGEPLIADSADPPQPYDAASVSSVVQYGTASGQLDMTAQDDANNRVYTYVYGPGVLIDRKLAAALQDSGSRLHVLRRHQLMAPPAPLLQMRATRRTRAPSCTTCCWQTCSQALLIITVWGMRPTASARS